MYDDISNRKLQFIFLSCIIILWTIILLSYCSILMKMSNSVNEMHSGSSSLIIGSLFYRVICILLIYQNTEIVERRTMIANYVWFKYMTKWFLRQMIFNYAILYLHSFNSESTLLSVFIGSNGSMSNSLVVIVLIAEMEKNETLWAIWYHLCNLKDVNNTYGEVLLWIKL